MNTRQKWTVVGLASLLLGVLYLLAARDQQSDSLPRNSDLGVPITENRLNGNSSGRQPNRVGSPGVQGLDGNVGERTLTQSPPFVARIRDAHGRPIVGATCVLTTLPAEDLSGLFVWGLSTQDGLVLDRVTRTTDLGGTAEYTREELSSLGAELLLWAWAPGTQANWTSVPAIREGESRQLEISLAPHAPLRINVLDAKGAPVSDAVVHAIGLTPKPGERPRPLAKRAMAGLRIQEKTDRSGIVALSPAPGSLVLWAEKGDLASRPIMDIPAEKTSITLQLGGTFLVSGEVVFPAGAKHNAEAQVTAYSWDGGSTTRLAQSRVREDGTVGPFRVPLIKTENYSFVLRGGSCLPATVRIKAPTANSHERIRFALDSGISLRVHVTDIANEPISGADLLAKWTAAGGDAQVAVTGADGYGVLHGVHASMVSVRASAPGFAPVQVYGVDAPEYQGGVVEMRLVRGGTITGVVSHGTDPVDDFNVVFWQPTAAQSRTELEFHASEGGVFEIDGVPLGDLLVYATSRDYPRSEVRAVQVQPNEAAQVALDLPTPLTAMGQVLDGVTSEPVESASIQAWNSYRAAYLSPFGKAQVVDSDGLFRIAGFSPGNSRYVVRAVGYSQYLGQAVGQVGEVIDLGIIALQRTQPFRVRLTSTVPMDFTRFEADADGNAPYPPQRFDGKGVVTWPEAGPNLYFVRVYRPDDTLMTLEEYCRPGVDWEFVLPQDPTTTLDLLVTDAEGGAPRIPGETTVSLHYSPLHGNRLTHTALLDENSRAHFSTVAARTVYAEVIAESGDRLGAKTLILEDGSNEARIVLGGKNVRVHVTDREGTNLEGASLDLRMAAGESPWFQLTSTDAAGLHTFTGLAMERLFISVQHNQFGVKSDVEVDLNTWKSEDTLEVVLDPRSSLAIRLVDGSTPIPAASLRILGHQSHHIIGVFTTNAAGIVRHGPVSPGSYLISVEQPGVWLTEKLVEAGDKDQVQDIQVRKLGSLVLRLTTSASQPSVGARVELESVESGAKLSDWIARGLVSVEGGALTTDAEGVARVGGIPHGEYLVRVSGPGGSLVAGRIRVLPGPLTSVDLTLP